MGCALALALDKPTTIHVDFVLSRVRMLLDFGVTPYLVFDGDNIPSKQCTNSGRHKRRAESKARAMELHKAGKASQAYQEFQKAVDVTPLMARQLINELKKLNVQYVVAPYEADAQLVYLEQHGIIDGILSEDSDLLVFGAKRLLTKLNQYGELVEIDRADLAICKEISFAGWTDTMFRRMAILSGCDYLPNIGKLGLKTAHAHIRKHKDVEKILRIIQFEGKLIVPDKYLEQFKDAELTFLHHRVFCPLKQKMVFLNELGPGLLESSLPFLGPYVEPNLAIGVACGDLDPFSKKPLRLDPQKNYGRPVLADSKRQSYASDSALKPRKSIDTFFQPYRQPLAELDPNSLTPSPSQQRLLVRNRNASWEPRLVSSAPALRRTYTTGASGSSTPAVEAADRASFLARASALSTYKPPKRQRLCSDSMDPSPSREVKQSPFFSPKQEDLSPLAHRKAGGKKPRRSGFQVFSEISKGEMLHEAEIQQVASPREGTKKGQSSPPSTTEGTDADGLLDFVPQSSPGPASPVRSSTIIRAGGQSASTETNGSSTPASRELSHDKDPDEFEDLLEFHVRKQNEALFRTFAYQPEQRRSSALESFSPKRASGRTFSAQSIEAQTEALRKLPKTTSLETICDDLGLKKTFAYQLSNVQQSALRNLSRITTTAEKNSTVRTASINLPQGDRDVAIDRKGRFGCKHDFIGTSQQFVSVSRGSEDAIVPNSEDESSEIGSPAPKARLDLSKFAFAP